MTVSLLSETADKAPLANLLSIIRREYVWPATVLLMVVFSLTTPHFLSAYNLSNILFESTLVGLLAVGLTPVVISGNIDLTVGAVVGLSACLVTKLEALGLGISIGSTLAVGAALGLFNGLLVERLGISSFIVTLAGMIGIRGLAFLYAGNTSVSPIDGRLSNLSDLSVGPVGAIPLLFLFSVAGFQWILNRTVHGRNTFAIGGNRAAAVDAGVLVSQHVIANFVLCGLMAAVCGVAMAANLGAAAPSFGRDYELWAVIAVVLGGTRLRGGKGSVIGTFAAVLALAILRNGLNLLNVPPFFIPLIIGTALIVALVLDRGFGKRAGPTGE
ncbi:ABC transporter permease [Bradyrhizobium manausense]